MSLEDDSVDDNVDPDADADYIMLPMNKNCKFFIIYNIFNLLICTFSFEFMFILQFCLDVGKLCEKEFKLKIDAHIDENNVDRKPIISESGEGKYKVFSLVI